MGINIPANSSLGSISFQFFFLFFFSAKMNLTVFAGILLAVTSATARRASLGEKTMQAADEADEPEKAARPASLVEKITRAADEKYEPEAKRANGECKPTCNPANLKTCNGCFQDNDCCEGNCKQPRGRMATDDQLAALMAMNPWIKLCI